MKHFIFLICGTAPDLGSFYKGEIKQFKFKKISGHVQRGTLKAIEDLEEDELIYWLMDRGINPPDKFNKSELAKLLIKGKISPKKKKTTEEVTKDV